MAESRAIETQPVTAHPLSRWSTSLDGLLSLIWRKMRGSNSQGAKHSTVFKTVPIASFWVDLPKI